MSASKLGTLNAELLVDEASRSHYGHSDKVTGHVVLTYKPSSSMFSRNAVTADLFGPLKVNVVLSGKVRIKVRRDRSHHMPTSHGMIFFEQAFPVFNGSFKAEVENEFRYPFEASFPRDNPAPYPQPGIGLYSTLIKSGKSSSQLPPTMAQHFSDYPDVVDLAVLYRLSVHINMPGIDIKTKTPEGDDRPIIRYDLPQPSKELIDQGIKAFKLQAKVQTEHLLPLEERPQGFTAKAKAKLNSKQFPEFVIDIMCSGHEYIYPGQQLKYEIVIRRNEKESTTEFFPETILESFKVDLSAFTAVDTSSRMIGSPQCNDRKTVQVLTCQSSLPQPFSKANDHTISVTTTTVQKHAASFIQQKFSRQYLLRVTMQLKVANKTIRQSRDCPVIIVPPPTSAMNGEWIPEPPPDAAPSYLEEHQLPAYGEAGSSTLLKAS